MKVPIKRLRGLVDNTDYDKSIELHELEGYAFHYVKYIDIINVKELAAVMYLLRMNVGLLDKKSTFIGRHMKIDSNYEAIRSLANRYTEGELKRDVGQKPDAIFLSDKHAVGYEFFKVSSHKRDKKGDTIHRYRKIIESSVNSGDGYLLLSDESWLKTNFERTIRSHIKSGVKGEETYYNLIKDKYDVSEDDISIYFVVDLRDVNLLSFTSFASRNTDKKDIYLSQAVKLLDEEWGIYYLLHLFEDSLREAIREKLPNGRNIKVVLMYEVNASQNVYIKRAEEDGLSIHENTLSCYGFDKDKKLNDIILTALAIEDEDDLEKLLSKHIKNVNHERNLRRINYPYMKELTLIDNKVMIDSPVTASELIKRKNEKAILNANKEFNLVFDTIQLRERYLMGIDGNNVDPKVNSGNVKRPLTKAEKMAIKSINSDEIKRVIISIAEANYNMKFKSKKDCLSIQRYLPTAIIKDDDDITDDELMDSLVDAIKLIGGFDGIEEP